MWMTRDQARNGLLGGRGQRTHRLGGIIPCVAEPIGIEEARRLVLAEISPLDAGEVPVGEALGRVLAEDVSSDVDVPPFDSSAMDGFAVAAGRHRGPAGGGRVPGRAPVRRRAGGG